MNTYDVKKNLGFFYFTKLIISGIAIYFAFTKGNSLFQSVVIGLYVSSVLTLSSIIYKKIKNVLGTILILIVVFIAFIKLPIPRVIISVMMLLMMFLGIVYDCFQWVRLAEISYDYKHGNKEKWLELDRMVRSTKHYSSEERRVSFIASVSEQKHKEGHELAVKMASYITASDQIWSKLQSYANNTDVSVLYKEYNQVISESNNIRQYFEIENTCSVDPTIESNRYEEMREYFNRFQRIRKRLDDLQRQYLGSGKTTTNSVSETSKYFNDCNSMESLQKRYKDLCKVYHPDMGNGSAEIFAEIQATYENLKKKYE